MKHGCADGSHRIMEFIDANVAAMFRGRTKVGAALPDRTEVKRIR
jgi:hypothetical protein